MISALAFVPKGASSAHPARQVPSAQELEMLRQMDELGIVDAEGVAVKADEMEDDDRDIAQLTGAEAAVAAAAAADGEVEDDDDSEGNSDDEPDAGEAEDGEEVVVDSNDVDENGLPKSLRMDEYDDEPDDINLLSG